MGLFNNSRKPGAPPSGPRMEASPVPPAARPLAPATGDVLAEPGAGAGAEVVQAAPRAVPLGEKQEAAPPAAKAEPEGDLFGIFRKEEKYIGEAASSLAAEMEAVGAEELLADLHAFLASLGPER